MWAHSWTGDCVPAAQCAGGMTHCCGSQLINESAEMQRNRATTSRETTPGFHFVTARKRSTQEFSEDEGDADAHNQYRRQRTRSIVDSTDTEDEHHSNRYDERHSRIIAASNQQSESQPTIPRPMLLRSSATSDWTVLQRASLLQSWFDNMDCLNNDSAAQ